MKLRTQLFLCLGLVLAVHLHSHALKKSQLPNNGTIKLWDVTNGKPHDVPLEQGDITALAFSPNSQSLAVGSANRQINLWDLNSGKKIASFVGHKGAIQSLAFSPDGRVLASASWDRKIKLWNVTTGRVLASLDGNSGEVLSVAFSPDRKYLASGGGDEKVRVWNLATNKIARIFEGHAGKINSVAFSFSGNFLATGSDDKTVRLWDVEGGRLLFTLAGHSDAVESVAFNPGDKTLASASRDQTIKIWDILSGAQMLTLKGHLSSIDRVAFSPNGRILASGSYDKTVKLWNSADGRELRTLEGHAQRITSLAFSPDGKLLASGSALNRFESPTLHVLAVGISNYYAPEWPTVDFAAKDATDFAAALEKIGRTKFERVNVHLLTNFRGSHMAISSSIFKIINEAKPQDTFVLFFAGLASSEFDKEVYKEQFGLRATNGEKISEVLLKSWLTKIEAQHQLIILEMKDPQHGYEPFLKRFAKENDVLKGLLKRDIVILANASEGIPILKQKNCFLTHALLEGLAGGAALESGELTVNSLVDYAKGKQAVMRKAILERTGEITSYAVGEDFHLGYVPKSRFISAEDATRNHPAFEASSLRRLLPGGSVWMSKTGAHTPLMSARQHQSERSIVALPASRLPQPDGNIRRKGKDYALLIATDKYDKWKPLENPVLDAKAVAEELEKYYGFQTEVVPNPTKKEIREVLLKYVNQKYADDDQLFIFFAGHGTYIQITTDGYLIAKDSDANDTTGDSYVSYHVLRRIINNIPCRHILLAIDACFGGTFDEAIARRGSDNDIPPPELIDRRMQFMTRRYLTSGGKEYVSDGVKGRHSPFTRKLLEALRSYGGKDGFLTINKILPFFDGIDPTAYNGAWGDNEPGSDFFLIVKRP
jgi:WD40 repeat protein